ncbi:MAG: 50S ribosomal protein L4 [Bdellovibrionales bacterium]
MAKTAVLNWNKDKVSDIDLKDEVFGKELRKDLLQTVVKWQLACRRKGTHSTKTKGEVRGGGAKPFRQKGTGNARQGSNRSPLMPGGGTIFGPRPRDYSYTLPRKIKQAGLKTALSYLLNSDKLFVVEDMKSEGKTKELASRLKSFGLEKVVLIDAESNEAFARAARNLPKVRYYSTEGLNVYDLLKYDALVVTKDSIDKINARCGVN